VPHHVWLGDASLDGDHGDTAPVIRAYLFVERQDHRVHVASEDHVHYPGLQVFALHAGNGTVVFHAQEHAPTLEVGKRDNLPGQLLGSNVVALELDPGALTVGNQFEQFRLQHDGASVVIFLFAL
jgi:hypothetical protein